MKVQRCFVLLQSTAVDTLQWQYFLLSLQQFERSQAKMLIKINMCVCVCARVCDICADHREKQQACRVNRKSEWVRK